jgi:hypothetical protein
MKLRTRFAPTCATALKVATLGVFLACSSGDNTITDAGSDGTVDATSDASVDSGKDSAVDAGMDSGHDSGADADAGVDSGSDASDDASDASNDVETDVITDSGFDGSTLDATVTCGPISGYGFVSVGDGGGGCGTGEDYMCGTDSYQLECDCPSGICTCEKNGIPHGSGGVYGGCPSCTTTPSFSSIATMCGVPY